MIVVYLKSTHKNISSIDKKLAFSETDNGNSTKMLFCNETPRTYVFLLLIPPYI
jgi:hypothetical protein